LISLWLAAFGCWWWWCVTFASNCWVAGSILLPSRTIHTVDGSACCIVCKQ
jgi:hypothetical protein